MADYYPLIARAIAGLDPSAPGESRRALYERARAALIAQLRSVQPPLSESEITRERLSLEEAVRKVESEAAQRAREASRPAAAMQRPATLAPAATPSAAPMPAPPEAAPAPPRAPPRRSRRRAAASRRPSAQGRPPLGQEERPPRNPRADAPPLRPRPQPPQQSDAGSACCRRPASAPVRRAAVPTTARRRCRSRRACAVSATSPPTPTISAAPRLQANRDARKTYANVPSPSPEFDRLEPSMENRGADPDAPYSYDESLAGGRPLRAATARQMQPPPRSRLARDHEPRAEAHARAPMVFPFKSAIAVGLVLILVGAGDPVGQVGRDGGERPVQTVGRRGGSAKRYRCAAGEAEDPGSRRPAVVVAKQVAPVAQRVVLYDEDPVRSQGQAICRLGDLAHRTDQGERPARSRISPCAPTSRFPTASSR